MPTKTATATTEATVEVTEASTAEVTEAATAEQTAEITEAATAETTAEQTEAALVGQVWTQDTVTQAMQTLRGEFAPISDMRATAAYRSTVLGNLLQRFWLESQGTAHTDVRSLSLDDAAQGVAA